MNTIGHPEGEARRIFFLISALLIFPFTQSFAQEKKENITYFSCTVQEPYFSGSGEITEEPDAVLTVTVKFSVKNLDMFKGKGELIQYPGSTKKDEEYGAILVTPKTYDKKGQGKSVKMTNLNGQGGDLRIEGDNIRLWGDGDGYQFTELVIWDVDNPDTNDLEGYVRDYGPTYGDEETFKQFIECKRSLKKL